MLEEMYGIRPINPSISHSADWAKLSRVQFCLFVLDNAVYDSGTFSIAKTRALSHTHNREKYRHPSLQSGMSTISYPILMLRLCLGKLSILLSRKLL